MDPLVSYQLHCIVYGGHCPLKDLLVCKAQQVC